jgi:hypothetical protein
MGGAGKAAPSAVAWGISHVIALVLQELLHHLPADQAVLVQVPGPVAVEAHLVSQRWLGEVKLLLLLFLSSTIAATTICS